MQSTKPLVLPCLGPRPPDLVTTRSPSSPVLALAHRLSPLTSAGTLESQKRPKENSHLSAHARHSQAREQPPVALDQCEQGFELQGPGGSLCTCQELLGGWGSYLSSPCPCTPRTSLVQVSPAGSGGVGKWQQRLLLLPPSTGRGHGAGGCFLQGLSLGTTLQLRAGAASWLGSKSSGEPEAQAQGLVLS